MQKHLYFIKAVLSFSLALAVQCFYGAALAQTSDPVKRAVDKKVAQLVLQLGSGGEQSSSTFSPDGTLLLSSNGNDVILWDAISGKELRRFRGYKRRIKCVAFSPDSRFIAAGEGAIGYDEYNPSQIFIWDPTTGERVKKLREPNPIDFIKYSPDGRYILTNHSLWDAGTGARILRLGNSNAHFSPDSRLLLTISHKAVLYDIEKRKELRRFSKDAADVECTAFSPDSRFILTAQDSEYAKNTIDYAVTLWDATTGQKVRDFTGHTAPVYAVAFSPDGKFALTGSGEYIGSEMSEAPKRSRKKSTVKAAGKYIDCGARLWNVASGQQVRQYKEQSPVTWVEYSRDARLILTNQSIIEADSGRVIRRKNIEGYSSKEFHYIDMSQEPYALFSPDEKMFLRGGQLFDATTGKEKLSFSGQVKTEDSSHMSLSADGRLMLTWAFRDYSSASPILWDLNSGKEIWRFGDFFNANSAILDRSTTAALSPDGRLMITGYESRDKTLARLYDAATLEELGAFGKGPASIISAAISPNGRFVLLGGTDHASDIIKRFTESNINTPEDIFRTPVALLYEARTGRLVKSFESEFGSLAGAVVEVSFSKDSRFAVVTCVKGTVFIWDIEAGKKTEIVTGHKILESATLLPDNRHMLITGDGIELWDIATGKKARRGFEGLISSAVISSRGRYVLSGGGSNRGLPGNPPTLMAPPIEVESFDAQLRSAGTGKLLYSFEHPAPIRWTAFTPDERFAVTASADNMTRFWDTATGQESLRLISLDHGVWVAITPDGRFDTNDLGEISGLHWVFGEEPFAALPLEIFSRDYYTPRLIARVLSGERLPDLPSIAGLNRAQPVLEIKSVERKRMPAIACRSRSKYRIWLRCGKEIRL